MGGPAGSVWDGNPDADLGSLYSFLDVQHMRGGRASSFLWKSDRISGRYPAAFGNLPVEKEKTAKEVNKELENKGTEAGAYLFIHCGGRRLAIEERIDEVAELLKKEAHGVPFIAAFTFGEYGVKDHGANTTGGLMLSFTGFSK